MTARQSFRLEFPAEPGRVIRGHRVEPDRPSASAPWVLILHGFKGFKDWGFFPLLARRLAEAGLAAVGFSFSGCGVGEDLESFTELEAFRRDTLSRQLEDLERVLAFVRAGELGGLDPDRAGLFGHSRGGGLALVHAAETNAWRAVVTWAAVDTFDRWDEMTKRAWRERGRLMVVNSRTGQELELGLDALDDFEHNRDRFDVEAACRRLSTPALLMHGSSDEVVPASAVERLAQALPAGAGRALVLDGEGHTFGATHPLRSVPAGLERALSETVGWLERRLCGDVQGQAGSGNRPGSGA